MPTTAPRQRASRHRQPYSRFFRELGPDQRQNELRHLKKLYDEDRLSIRQIAKLKTSSYGFMQGKLVEAGANIAGNRRPKPTASADVASQADDTVTTQRAGRGTRP
ncbi:hypothetical protein DMB66_58035 [Actinoplanes sp. ATCC 53533]|uniref:helix-turn-helix domain-containing protein n=1 Tax=Actinoplanes sp. ATCC 53533 TaxID=1288362 RepID=UPI000F770B30|nr:hypothetical protein [Actinoplanes sp. ATCC 53533]RSM39604.1 hypothetical protein DMB66_58035 [Actinoplanes sp. ATCC 53533]